MARRRMREVGSTVRRSPRPSTTGWATLSEARSSPTSGLVWRCSGPAGAIRKAARTLRWYSGRVAAITMNDVEPIECPAYMTEGKRVRAST